MATRSFAEFDVAPANAVAVIPDTFDIVPFPGEAFGCAFNILRRSAIRPGDTVAIIGIGFLGAILTRLATDAGARVIAISRRSSSLALARAYGAAEVVEMVDHGAIIAKVQELANGRLCERVIECAGHQWPLDLAGELVGFGGRLVIAGYHQDGPRSVSMQMWNWKGIDVINAHERDVEVQVRGMREAIESVAGGKLDVKPLLTHRYSLEHLGRALDDTRDKPDGFVKAWIQL